MVKPESVTSHRTTVGYTQFINTAFTITMAFLLLAFGSLLLLGSVQFLARRGLKNTLLEALNWISLVLFVGSIVGFLWSDSSAEPEAFYSPAAVSQKPQHTPQERGPVKLLKFGDAVPLELEATYWLQGEPPRMGSGKIIVLDVWDQL